MYLYVLVKGETREVIDIPRCDRYTLGDMIKSLINKHGEDSIVLASENNVTDIIGYIIGLG